MISSVSSIVAPSILGLSHVGIKTADIERSCAFYRDFLGFAEQCRLNYLQTGELMLVCFKVSEEQWIEVFTGLRSGENRMHQVAFRVTDADQIRVRLAEQGAAVPAKTPKGQMGNFNFVVPDPSGQIVEFVQHLPNGITERDRGKFLPTTRVSSRIRHARIVATDLDQAESFYGNLGLTTVDAGGRSRQITSSGDFIEFVTDSNAGAEFCLEVGDISEARRKLERSSFRPHYSGSLESQVGPDGARFFDLFDPDGTCVRVIECR